LVGGYNKSNEAELVEFEFDFSTGKPEVVHQRRFGDTSGLSVISDFRFEEGGGFDSVVALDGQLGKFVRVSKSLPPVDLVSGAMGVEIQGLQCIQAYSEEAGHALYQLCEFHEGIYAKGDRGRTFVLRSSLELGRGQGEK
jgi:hypothetical protein